MAGYFGTGVAVGSRQVPSPIGNNGYFGGSAVVASGGGPTVLAMIGGGILQASQFTGYGNNADPNFPFAGLTPGASLTPDLLNGSQVNAIIANTALGANGGGIEVWVAGIHPQTFFTNVSIAGFWLNRTSASADQFIQDPNDPTPAYNWTVWRFFAAALQFAPFTLGGAYSVTFT